MIGDRSLVKDNICMTFYIMLMTIKFGSLSSTNSLKTTRTIILFTKKLVLYCTMPVCAKYVLSD